MLSIDFQKAFDKISYSRILKSLQKFGIPRAVIMLVKSYLTDRMQRVSVDGFYSMLLIITSGIPQGSIIGPIIFSMVIDDIFSSIRQDENLIATTYADDLTNSLRGRR